MVIIPYDMKTFKAKNLNKKDRVLDSLPLPQDIIHGDIRISIMGNREIWVENYKGLLEYTSNAIVLQAKGCKIQLEGKSLNIDYYTNEDMKISGRLNCIKYF